MVVIKQRTGIMLAVFYGDSSPALSCSIKVVCCFRCSKSLQGLCMLKNAGGGDCFKDNSASNQTGTTKAMELYKDEKDDAEVIQVLDWQP
jgi:hypothetical protein